MSESSDYQRLRAHLSFLRMSAAAEALPAELDHPRAAGLTHQGFLERLLAVEVAAVDDRRHSASGPRNALGWRNPPMAPIIGREDRAVPGRWARSTDL